MTRERKLVIFTGAGISADSGISTFRDKDGTWENHSIAQVCDILTWRANREAVHAFYNARRSQLEGVEPNEAHRMIARLQARFPEVTTVITQNIDDLLERGGCTDVLHVHGSLLAMQCKACGHEWPQGYAPWDPLTDRCRCNSLKGVKPAVVFFNEGAPRYRHMHRALDALQDGDVLLVMGTSGQVIPIGVWAASMPAIAILSNLKSDDRISMPGAPVCEDRQFDHVLHGRAEEKAAEIEALVIRLMEAAPTD